MLHYAYSGRIAKTNNMMSLYHKVMLYCLLLLATGSDNYPLLSTIIVQIVYHTVSYLSNI